MRDRRLDRLFLRYRDRGDMRALGDVFDASAQELLRVATSLVRDPAEADDLLQATYLTAIEKAETWDPKRRLVPWLMGILVNHAHDLRRRRGREVDPDRLQEREAESPIEEATRVEATESLRGAIAGLPARYREVLEPFVERGQRPVEIAADLGRPPGTVRMQIHRGLDLLRKALPPGLALGALVTDALVTDALVTGAGPGRAAMREVVMRAAARRAAQLAAGASASSTTLLGTLTMTKKTLLASLAAAAVSSALWLAAGGLGSDGPGEGPGLGPATPALTGTELERAPASSPGFDGTPQPAPEGRIEVGVGAAPIPDATDYEANLAGLVGRLVEADGAPIPGLPIVLLELDMEALDRSAADAFLPPAERGSRWTVARTVSAADGTFRLGGARAHALLALGFDLGGDRPWTRLVDRFLEPAGETNLGAIVLPPVAPVTGRIVDGAGHPIEGVRVRAGALNDDRFDWERLAACDENTPVLVKQNKYLSVLVELPEHVKRLFEYVPFVERTTGPDGRFEFPAAPAQDLRLLLDHSAYQGRLVAVDPADGGELGDLLLGQGQVFSGRVIDGQGKPVAGAEVRGGDFFSLGWSGPELAALGASTFTNEGGDFYLTGLVDGDQPPVLAARASAAFPWVIHHPRGSGKTIIALPTRHDVAVRVLDGEGEPLEAELVAYQPSVLGSLAWGALLDAKIPRGEVEVTGPGTYVIHDLQKANYTLHVRAEGYAVGTARLRPRANARETLVTLEPERTLAVRVLDGESGRPIGRAAVGLMADRGSTRLLSRAETDGAGLARLGGVPARTEEGAYLRVTHPRFATRNLPLELAQDQELLVVRLGPGGAVLFQVRDEGRPPVAPVMIEFDWPKGSTWAGDYTKRFSLTDGQGDARLSYLPPGTWRWRAFERYLDGDPWQLMTRKVSAPFIASGEVTVVPDETSTVGIEVSGHEFALSIPSGSAAIRGHAWLNGEPFEGSLTVCYVDRPAYASRRIELEADGTFAADELTPGEYELSLWIVNRVAGGSFTELVLRRRFELVPEQTQQVDLELETTSARVEVLDAEGQAAAGVRVQLSSLDPEQFLDAGKLTDARGQLTFTVKQAGRVLLAARDPRLGRGRLEVRLALGEDNGPYRLSLDPGVQLSGTVQADLAATSVEGNAFEFEYRLQLTRNDNPLDMQSLPLTFDAAGRTTFELAGLSPGTWTAKLLGGPWNVGFESTSVLIGPTGTQAAVLEFGLRR
jgi:RNA polymerase sigma factor (sigma-70 family)